MYTAHVCFYVCYCDCVGSVRMFVCLRDVMDVVFSVCNVRRGAVGVRV